MILSEVLALELGPILAKIVASIWLDRRGIAENLAADAGSDLLSVLQRHIQNRLQQKQAARQFEELGEDVAKSLAVVFEMDNIHLERSSTASVVVAVAETLTISRISTDLLAEQNFESDRLTNHLLSCSPPSVQTLSAVEFDLYTRSIKHCAAMIIGISSRLPRFSESAFSELLRRLNSLRGEVIDEVRRIADDTSRLNPESALGARFESDYSRNVMEKLGRLEVIGIENANRSYALETAYTALRVKRRSSWDDNQSDAAIPSDISDLGSLTIPQALRDSYRVLVRGEPGAGKTTLLRWIAVHAANRTLTNELPSWKGVVPFFIRLRKYSSAKLPNPRLWIEDIADVIAGEMPPGWVNHLLRTGRAVVLVDGVDEVPSSSREHVRQWLDDLVHAYPDARYVVTSRGYAVSDNWLTQLEFDSFELQQMDPPQMTEFIDRWHETVRDQAFSLSEQSEIEQRRRDMHSAVRYDSPISKLATNPLLCAMLCELNRIRRGDIPTSRVDLYEKGCQMLLEARDKRRGICVGHYPKLNYEERSAILEYLAWWMLQNGQKEVSRQDAELVIRDALRWLRSQMAYETNPEGVYRLLVERSGVVREPEPGILDFVHLSFQEYLAAKHFRSRRLFGALVREAHDQRWQEVIPLTAAIADAPGQSTMILGLLGRGKESDVLYQRMGLLAVACAGGATRLDPRVGARLKRYMKRMRLPSDFEMARWWARAGELAIPFLSVDRLSKCQSEAHSETQFSQIADNCARVLALIGGSSALVVLQAYAERYQVHLGDALSWAWQFFDRDAYLEQVLAYCSTLHLSKVNEYSGQFPTQPNHSVLKIVDLETVVSLEHLQGLKIDDFSRVTDLRALLRLSNLRALHLGRCSQIHDLTPLVEFRDLRSLIISGCPSTIDSRLLCSLQHLDLVDIELTTPLRTGQLVGPSLDQSSLPKGFLVWTTDGGGQRFVLGDELLEAAIKCVQNADRASVSLLQRRLRIGYSRAMRVIDTLEALGIVGPDQGGVLGREVIQKPMPDRPMPDLSSPPWEWDNDSANF